MSLKVHALLAELLAYLNIEEDPEKCLETLTKRTLFTPQAAENTSNLSEKIALGAAKLSTDQPDRFRQIYDKLLHLKAPELDPVLYILHAFKAKEMKSSHSTGNLSDFKTPVKMTRNQSMIEDKRSPFQSALTQHSESKISGTPFRSQHSESKLSGTPLKSEISESKMGGSTFVSSPFSLLSDPSHTPTIQRKQQKSRQNVSKTKEFKKQYQQLVQETNATEALTMMSPKEQEANIIQDLLYVMMGIDGELITRKSKPNEPIQYKINEKINASLAELVQKILPICTYYKNIEQFLESHSSFDYGRVHHALCASIKQMTQEYLVLVAQLEHQSNTNPLFSLQKLLYYVQPSMETLGSIDSLVNQLKQSESRSNAKSGGLVLTLLSQKMALNAGHQKTRDLYEFMLKEASKPFYDMLRQWIYNGVLDDPYNEFMIQDNGVSKESVKEDFNDLYWEQKYTMLQDWVPSFLEKQSDKILRSGKYLNVLRECGKQLEQPKPTGQIDQEIEQGYLNANKQLLDMLMKEFKLIERLRSIKNLFLLNQSDYLTHFLDLALDHLKQPKEVISLPKLKALLELVIRSSSTVASSDPYRDAFSVELSQMSLFDQLMKINTVVGVNMKKHFENLKSGRSFAIQESLDEQNVVKTTDGLTGVDVFMLSYNTVFPLSLVLSKRTLSKYQMLFRHLLKCKYTERLLSGAWLSTNKLHSRLANKRLDIEEQEHQVLNQMAALRGKMLHFVQQMIWHLFVQVIEPQWIQMESRIHQSKTVDQLLETHDDFLNSSLKESMLTQPKLLSVFYSVLDTCNQFSDLAQQFTFMRLPDDQIVDQEFS
ncbi:Spc98 family-domain-containing protein [Gorgonomyces haynaldii]|nr:Spc98 family-domain-containing protein [Gorgonomyces haynaldii]